MSRLVAALVLSGLFGGCQTARPIFYWGSYEALAYQSYIAPGKVPPAEQIATLKGELEKARAANLPAHPGLHAHLGFLYTQIGKADLARVEFETEKRLFPESAKFIDGLMNPPKSAAQP